MPHVISELKPSWVVHGIGELESNLEHSDNTARVGILVTWNGDLAIFWNGELQAWRNIGIPTAHEIYAVLELNPMVWSAHIVPVPEPPQIEGEILELPTVQVILPVTLNKELVQGLQRLAHRHNVTLFVVLLTIWLGTRVKGGHVYSVRVPWSERLTEDMHVAIGNFIRMLSVRGTWTGSFDQNIAETQNAIVAAINELETAPELAATEDQATQDDGDSVFAWEFEGGGWISATHGRSTELPDLMWVPQSGYPHPSCTLSLSCARSGDITGWVQSLEESGGLDFAATVEGFMSDCRRHATQQDI